MKRDLRRRVTRRECETRHKLFPLKHIRLPAHEPLRRDGGAPLHPYSNQVHRGTSLIPSDSTSVQEINNIKHSAGVLSLIAHLFFHY